LRRVLNQEGERDWKDVVFDCSMLKQNCASCWLHY